MLRSGWDVADAGARVVAHDDHGALRLAAAWAWTPRSTELKSYRLAAWASGQGPTSDTFPSKSEVGVRIASDMRLLFGFALVREWVEMPIVGRGGPVTAVKCGISIGELCGPSVRFAERRELALVRATEWRPGVLGISPFAKTDVAKRASLERIPLLLEGVRECMAALAWALGQRPTEMHNLTDAVGVLLHGAMADTRTERKP